MAGVAAEDDVDDVDDVDVDVDVDIIEESVE
jgi:hypothetical protein